MRLPKTPAELGPRPWVPGIELFNGGANYERTLMLARAGTLVFLLLTLALTYLLAGGRRRPFPAFVATALVATYPPLLGHAGFVTTDVAAVATVLLFLFALDRWSDFPSLGRAALLGSAFALASLCKLTAPFACLALGLAWLYGRRWSRGTWISGEKPRLGKLLGHAALAGASALFVVWAGYRFSTGTLDGMPAASFMGTPVLPPAGQRSALLSWLCRLPLLAPEFWHGFFFLEAHSAHGHPAFLLGKISEHGFWDFFLVGLLLKSPLPFLALFGLSLTRLFRRAGRSSLGSAGLGSALAAGGALALSTVITVNIGFRHVLIVVPLLAIFIANAVAPWIAGLAARRQVIAGTILVLLLAADAASVEAARPELMAYFNPLAGREPGHALIDSDLDWGQDFLILKSALRARAIASLHYGFFGTMDPCGPDLPTLLPLKPGQPVTGWVVLSEQFYRSNFFLTLQRE
jgi:hypothetical protein